MARKTSTKQTRVGGLDLNPGQGRILEQVKKQLALPRKTVSDYYRIGELLQHLPAGNSQVIQQETGGQETHQRRQAKQPHQQAQGKSQGNPDDVTQCDRNPLKIHGLLTHSYS